MGCARARGVADSVRRRPHVRAGLIMDVEHLKKMIRLRSPRALSAAILQHPIFIKNALNRDPDFIIGDPLNPYLLRWHLTQTDPKWNNYLHLFLRDDDDRALHDHPWDNLSMVMVGGYVEHTIAAGGVNHREEFRAGDIKYRKAADAHRIELIDGRPCMTLFITGPKIRDWGFHCPKGWVRWQEFTAESNGGVTGVSTIGRGCGEFA